MKQSRLNYTDIWHKLNKDGFENANISQKSLEMLHSLSPICDKPPAHLEQYASQSKYINETDADIQFYNYAKRVAPTLNETLFRCTWHRQDVNCSDIFKEVLTDEGVCFTFNQLNASELYNEERLNEHFHVTQHNKSTRFWNGVNLKPNMTEADIYPYRVLSGSEGLRVDLRLYEFDIDYVCSGPVQSFKILLHSAGEIPQMRKYYYRIPLDHDTMMAVRPNIMNTTESLIKNYKKDQRKCIDEGERELIFFKKYTQRNCQLDNLAFRTGYRCKCVTFAMPRLPNVPICRSAAQLQCVKSVENSLMQQVLNKTAISYNCFPACRSISYDAEMSMARLDRYNHQKAMKQVAKIQRKRKYTRVFISFKDEQFFSSRRAEVYTLIDFVANCGGILGLFMGISILSIVEIVYFGTLRIGCSLRKRRLAKKKRLQHLKELNEQLNNDVNNVENHSEYDNLPEMTY